MIEARLHLAAKRSEHLALLHGSDRLERADVGGVNGEEVNERVQPLRHRRVEGGERPQIVADSYPLLGRLAQQPLRDDVCHVLPGDLHLLEPGPHPPQRLGDELEPGRVEERLLQAANEAEARSAADLTDLAEEVQVEDHLLLVARA